MIQTQKVPGTLSARHHPVRSALFSFVLFFLVFGCRMPGRQGEQAPDFSLSSFEKPNEKVVLSEVSKARPVLLAFWATWCPSCVEEIPVLNEWAEKYQTHLALWGVNVQETPEEIREFIKSHKVNYPILLDKDGEVADLFGLIGLPASVLIAKGGKIVYYGFSLPPSIESVMETQ